MKAGEVPMEKMLKRGGSKCQALSIHAVRLNALSRGSRFDPEEWQPRAPSR